MGEALITTEIENQLLELDRLDAEEMKKEAPLAVLNVAFEEKEVARRHARAILDIFYDVHRECVHINLGLVPDPDQD